LSTVRDADTILVMEDGAIVEHGSHEQLLAADGAYRRLYMSQFRGEDAEERFTAEVLAETEAEAGTLPDETPAGETPLPNERHGAAADSGADRTCSASAADNVDARCREKCMES